MSTRWYPIYQRGNPQLRIFLPNFWLKLLKPKADQPPNMVRFMCPPEMTRYDVEQYLKKIYGVPVMKVNTRVVLGEFKRCENGGHIIKGDDYKLAYVTMPRDETFTFPNIFEETENKKLDKRNQTLDDTKEGFKNYLDKNRERHGIPSWYTF